VIAVNTDHTVRLTYVYLQRIWFLAKTVALCEQQYHVLHGQLPSVQTKFLCGADNVDNWSEQIVWDGVLHNVRLVVSTYQVLFDAMVHNFVKLESLALIVFDEGRRCCCFLDCSLAGSF
jgi:ERCC4-related helicase